MLLVLFVIAEVERLVYDMVLKDPVTFELFEELKNTFDYVPNVESSAESTPETDTSPDSAPETDLPPDSAPETDLPTNSAPETDSETDSSFHPDEWRPHSFPYLASKVSRSCYNPKSDTSEKFIPPQIKPVIQLAQAQTQMLAEQFERKLVELQESSDEVWVFLANFVIIAREFRLFVKSYRRGDSIAVESIMASWLPIWNACDRKNYCKLSILQMENLYDRLKFSQLQRLRMNRFVRLYKDDVKGEHQWGRMLATDDMCEILNDWLKVMPTAETAEAWQELSYLVGVGRRCIRHTDVYYNNSKENTKAAPKSTTQPKMSRQKQRIYELLVLATKGSIIPGRKMKTDFFANEIKNLKTNLDAEKYPRRKRTKRQTHRKPHLKSQVIQ